MSDYQELSTALPDGYSAYVRYWPVGEPAGAVLYLHGIQSHCGWYEESARRLQQAGFAVLQPDRRGSGRNQADRGHAESQQQLIDDGLACGRRLLELTGLKQFHLIGISWGGKLACALAAAEPGLVRSLSLVCPGLFPRVARSAQRDAEPVERDLFYCTRPGRAMDCHPPPRRGGRVAWPQFHGFRSPLANSTRGYSRRPRRGRIRIRPEGQRRELKGRMNN